MPNTIASTDVGGTGLSTVGTNGQVLTSNGTTLSWVTPTAVTPGGSTTQVQYNSSGSFAGSANFTYSSNTLFLGGFAGEGFRLTSTSTNGSKLQIFSNAQTNNQFQIGQGYATGTDNIAYIYNSANADMLFATNASEKIRISSAGLVSLSNGVGFVNQTWSTRPSSPTSGQQGFNTTLSAMEYWNGTSWVQYGQASVSTITYLIVAGGGGAGGGNNSGSNGTGGGGAGGLLTGTTSVSSGSAYTITVGGGGAGSTAAAQASGSNSTAFSLTAIGGGKGGSGDSKPGGSGGSGGGSGSNSGVGPAGAGTSGQGNPGGVALENSPNYPGGGGGGAGATGGSVSSGSVAGNGGIGVTNSISGTSVYYAGGGGGGLYVSGGTPGSGGSGGGGNGVNTGSNGGNGTANTGGGAGGTGGPNTSSSGGTGGSGVVVISYGSQYKAAVVTGGGVVTSSGGNQIYTFTSSGTITF
jgi:hypothetical protein